VVIVGCGPLVHNALLAAKELDKEKIGTVVVNCHTVKPLDEAGLLTLVKKYPAVVTVEEHQVIGGLGGAVADMLVKNFPVPMEFVGMQNTFGESGSPKELVEKYGMGVKDIKMAVKRVLKRK
ncbi:transketolase C-terminal domain-containing protein, partial [Staphylococcus aureus]|uniref:transketolase C-terminal domain-containing protein n=1 Tax=Staphylococcus aureus TaxID=1280 RepID=UPI0039BEB395